MMKRDPLLKTDESMISELDSQTQILGVDGKFMWPVRIVSFLSYIATVLVNYLQGMKTGDYSRANHLWVTPPGMFFTIWIVIYSTVLAVNIYNLIKNVWNIKAHIFFFISNILNMTWILVIQANAGSVTQYVSSIDLIVTVPVLLNVWIQLGNRKDEDFTIWIYITRNVFAFYLGWVIAAANINFGTLTVHEWGMDKKAQLIMFWIMAPLCAVLGTLFNGIREGKRGLLSCFALWFSVVWAFVGAGITSNGCLNGTIDLC